MVSLRSRRVDLSHRCKVRVPKKREERQRGMNADQRGRWAEVGSRVDGKFAPAIFRGVVGQKGTQCRGQDRFSSLERRGSRTRRGPGRGYVARDAAASEPHCCRNDAPPGLRKQRATGLPRGVINHFLLRKAARERKRRLPRARSSRESGSRVDGLARDSRIEPIAQMI